MVLRQGWVCDDLIELARTRGIAGWLDPPLCVFQELPEWLGATARKPLDDFERAALLSSSLRSSAGKVFGSVRRLEDFSHWVERLFGDLASEGVTADAYEAALAVEGARGAFECERDAELARAYRAYRDSMDRFGRRDGRDSLVDCAQALRDDPRALAHKLGGRREIRIFGLHDVRGGWRSLLRALLQSPALDRVIIFAPDAVELGLDRVSNVERVPEPQTPATRLFSTATPPDVALDLFDRFDLIAAPDVEREVEEVARRVRQLVEGCVSPDRIAVVPRQARPYVDMAIRCLRRFGVPATARRRFAYQDIPVVRATLSLFAAAAEGWSRHALVELAEQWSTGCG